MRSRSSWTVAAVVLGSLVAGCGDDEGTTTTAGAGGGEGLSKREFVRRANDLCADMTRQVKGPELKAFNRRVDRALQRGEPPPPNREYDLNVVIPAMKVLIERIRSLPPPAGDEDEVEAILVAAQDAAAELKRNAGKTIAIDLPFILEFRSRMVRKAGVLAAAYGLDKCK
jgi:hypothetical protein